MEKIKQTPIYRKIRKKINREEDWKKRIGRAKFIQVPAPDFSSKSKVDLDSVLGSVEMKYLNAALLHSNGIKKKAADLLGITFRSFRYRLKKHEMDES